ncbi:LysR substrate-binding domain-containing protein [Streptomyces sp. NPDC020983]|uniref:LysR substrate-binding domain-containing protein n=1 Tax=Streptomyces sp. NPDC020983 TaxID=3365106 RepID=UPI0037922F62
MTTSAPSARADRARAEHPPIRCGLHASHTMADRIVAGAGWPADAVRWLPFEVDDPFTALRAGQTDLMVVKYLPRTPDLEVSRPVWHDPRAVAVGAHHPLTRRGALTLEDVADFPDFRCPADFPPEVWDEVVPRTAPSGRPIRRVHPMTTVRAMADVLLAGDAVHLSFLSLATAVPAGIEVLPVHGLPPGPVALAWLRGTPLPGHVARFVRDAENAEARRTAAAEPAR